MAVTGVSGTDTVDLDSGVNGEDSVEDCEEGAEDQGCKRRGAELGRVAVASCEGVCGVEKTQGGGHKARSACRETCELVEHPWKDSEGGGWKLRKDGIKSKEGAMADEPDGNGEGVAGG